MNWNAYQLRMALYETTVRWVRPIRGGWHSFKWANLKSLGMAEGNLYFMVSRNRYPSVPGDVCGAGNNQE